MTSYNIWDFNINNYSRHESTNEQNNNSKRDIPDEKHIISTNEENKNGERVNDFSKEMQNNEKNSGNIFQQKSNEKEIKKQNYINNVFIENIEKSSAEDELFRITKKISNEGFTIINERNNRAKPFRTNYNTMTDFSDNKEDNKNNLKNENRMIINGVDITFGNNKADNRLKFNPKKINDRYGILNQNNNKVRNSVKCISVNPNSNSNSNKDNVKQEYNKDEDLILKKNLDVNPNLNKDNAKRKKIKIEDFVFKINNNHQEKDLKKSSSFEHFPTIC